MAKSLRASSKVKARNARRYTPNTDYAITQAARLNAISKRLAQRTRGPTVTEADQQRLEQEANGANTSGQEEDEVEEVVQEEGGSEHSLKEMEVEATPGKKISTSGPRGSRRETWRKARGWKPKQGTKNGGKPKRRR